MTVRLEEDRIVLEGVCRVEDAEPLAGLLEAHPRQVVDLSRCEGLHGAILQALLVFSRPTVGLEGNPNLNAWLAPLLAAQNPASAANTQDKPRNGPYNSSFTTAGEERTDQ